MERNHLGRGMASSKRTAKEPSSPALEIPRRGKEEGVDMQNGHIFLAEKI